MESSVAEASLTGCYLLIIVSEPFSQEHKERIIQKVAKGLLSWDIETTGCDLVGVENVCKYAEPEEGSDMLIQHATENLAVEVLLNPEVTTVRQCLKNLLSSTTKHKHLIHAGYSFAGSGAWLLQDGTFSFRDFTEAFRDNEVQRILKAYPGCTIHVHCTAEGDWNQNNIDKHSFSRLASVSLNPPDKISSLPGSAALTECLESAVVYQPLEEIMKSSSVVGNIRFHRPTLYVFPGGQGDCALFGVSGFNMLIDGGFTRKPCFWEFIRHLDRLDAVLVTRLSESNLNGVTSMFKRKALEKVFPQVGYVFCNIAEVKYSPSDEMQKDRDELLVSVIHQGHEFLDNLYQSQLKPHLCYRASAMEPFTLYNKVGHGTLEMYVISPPRESRELKDFLYQWASFREHFSFVKTGMKFNDHDLSVPLCHAMSICALIVWRPSDPKDTISRILFPGSAPQSKIFEGLEKLKNLSVLNYPLCTASSLRSAGVEKSKFFPEKPFARMPIVKPRSSSPASQFLRKGKEGSPTRKETPSDKKTQPSEVIKTTLKRQDTPPKKTESNKEMIEKRNEQRESRKSAVAKKEFKSTPTKPAEPKSKGVKDVVNKKTVEAKVISRRTELSKTKSPPTPPRSPVKQIKTKTPTSSPKHEPRKVVKRPTTITSAATEDKKLEKEEVKEVIIETVEKTEIIDSNAEQEIVQTEPHDVEKQELEKETISTEEKVEKSEEEIICVEKEKTVPEKDIEEKPVLEELSTEEKEDEEPLLATTLDEVDGERGEPAEIAAMINGVILDEPDEAEEKGKLEAEHQKEEVEISQEEILPRKESVSIEVDMKDEEISDHDLGKFEETEIAVPSGHTAPSLMEELAVNEQIDQKITTTSEDNLDEEETSKIMSPKEQREILQSKICNEKDRDESDVAELTIGQEIEQKQQQLEKDTKEITVEAKEITVETKEITVETKDITVEAKEITVEAKEITVEAEEITVETKDITVEAKEITEETKDITVETIEITVSDKTITLEKQVEPTHPEVVELAAELIDDVKEALLKEKEQEHPSNHSQDVQAVNDQSALATDVHDVSISLISHEKKPAEEKDKHEPKQSTTLSFENSGKSLEGLKSEVDTNQENESIVKEVEAHVEYEIKDDVKTKAENIPENEVTVKYDVSKAENIPENEVTVKYDVRKAENNEVTEETVAKTSVLDYDVKATVTAEDKEEVLSKTVHDIEQVLETTLSKEEEHKEKLKKETKVCEELHLDIKEEAKEKVQEPPKETNETDTVVMQKEHGAVKIKKEEEENRHLLEEISSHNEVSSSKFDAEQYSNEIAAKKPFDTETKQPIVKEEVQLNQDTETSVISHLSQIEDISSSFIEETSVKESEHLRINGAAVDDDVVSVDHIELQENDDQNQLDICSQIDSKSLAKDVEPLHPVEELKKDIAQVSEIKDSSHIDDRKDIPDYKKHEDKETFEVAKITSKMEVTEEKYDVYAAVCIAKPVTKPSDEKIETSPSKTAQDKEAELGISTSFVEKEKPSKEDKAKPEEVIEKILKETNQAEIQEKTLTPSPEKITDQKKDSSVSKDEKQITVKEEEKIETKVSEPTKAIKVDELVLSASVHDTQTTTEPQETFPQPGETDVKKMDPMITTVAQKEVSEETQLRSETKYESGDLEVLISASKTSAMAERVVGDFNLTGKDESNLSSGSGATENFNDAPAYREDFKYATEDSKTEFPKEKDRKSMTEADDKSASTSVASESILKETQSVEKDSERKAATIEDTYSVKKEYFAEIEHDSESLRKSAESHFQKEENKTTITTEKVKGYEDKHSFIEEGHGMENFMTKDLHHTETAADSSEIQFSKTTKQSLNESIYNGNKNGTLLQEEEDSDYTREVVDVIHRSEKKEQKHDAEKFEEHSNSFDTQEYKETSTLPKHDVSSTETEKAIKISQETSSTVRKTSEEESKKIVETVSLAKSETESIKTDLPRPEKANVDVKLEEHLLQKETESKTTFEVSTDKVTTKESTSEHHDKVIFSSEEHKIFSSAEHDKPEIHVDTKTEQHVFQTDVKPTSFEQEPLSKTSVKESTHSSTTATDSKGFKVQRDIITGRQPQPQFSEFEITKDTDDDREFSSDSDSFDDQVEVLQRSGLNEDLKHHIQTEKRKLDSKLNVSEEDEKEEEEDDEMIRHPTPPGQDDFYSQIGATVARTETYKVSPRSKTEVRDEPLYEEPEEDPPIEEHPVYGKTLDADYPEFVSISEGTTPSEPQSPSPSGTTKTNGEPYSLEKSLYTISESQKPDEKPTDAIKLHDSKSKFSTTTTTTITSTSATKDHSSEITKSSSLTEKSGSDVSEIKAHKADDSTATQHTQLKDQNISSFVPPPYEFETQEHVHSKTESSKSDRPKPQEASRHVQMTDEADTSSVGSCTFPAFRNDAFPSDGSSSINGRSFDHKVPTVELERRTFRQGESIMTESMYGDLQFQQDTPPERHEYPYHLDKENGAKEDSNKLFEERLEKESSHSEDDYQHEYSMTESMEMTTSFIGSSLSEIGSQSGTATSQQNVSKKSSFQLEDWGKPMGLPSPPDPCEIQSPNSSKSTLRSKSSATPIKSVSNKLEDEKKNSRGSMDNGKSSNTPVKSGITKTIDKGTPTTKGKNTDGSVPVYVDLTYVPHHGDPQYCDINFFKRIRARYYVFSGTSPSKEVFNALLEAKKSWEDKTMEVTVIPTYETDTLGYWMALNQEALTELKIDVAPSASRCTISLQDHETSCAAYRLEF